MARITLRLPDDLHAQVRQKSHEKGISLNELIVDALENTLADVYSRFDDGQSVTARAGRLRAMLGDLVEPVELLNNVGRLSPEASLAEREDFRNSLPILDPPLSHTIIEEREDRF